MPSFCETWRNLNFFNKTIMRGENAGKKLSIYRENYIAIVLK